MMPGNVSSDEAGRKNSTGAAVEETHRERQARRIRENQRRSRQKRKDHIEELQNKLRECQAQGIQASAEMQAAARKVLEENTKLRRLLSIHGVRDDVISEYLVSGNVVAPRHRSRPSFLHRRSSVASTGQELEQLMAPRRPSCLESSDAFGASSASKPEYPKATNGAVSVKHESSVVAASPSWEINTQRDGLTPSIAFQQPEFQTPQQSQYIMAPSSATSLSRNDAALALTGLAQVNAGQQGPVTVSGGPLPTPPYTFNIQHFPSASEYNQHQPNGQELLLQGAAVPPSVPSNYLQAPSTENSSMAVDMMTGISRHDLRRQLNSMTGNDPHAGPVSYTNVMDRYA